MNRCFIWFIFFAIPVPQQALAEDPTIPIFLRDVVIDFDDNDEVRLIEGVRRHFHLAKKYYVVVVPLKFQTMGFEIRSVDIQEMSDTKFRIFSKDCRVTKTNGKAYPADELKKYLSVNKSAYVAFDFQKIDKQFLATLNSSVPIIRVTQPSLDDLKHDLQMSIGKLGKGPIKFGRHEVERMMNEITNTKSNNGGTIKEKSERQTNK